MGILSVGAKLIRDTKLGRVITETVGNKVFTNLYSKGGDLVSARVKQITRTNVGNKKVITIKKVKNKNYENYVIQNDKVYNQNGGLLGTRRIETDPQGVRKTVTKSVGAIEQEKQFKLGKVQNRSYTNSSILQEGEPVYIQTLYNNRGLPVPARYHRRPQEFDGRSLEQMRKFAANKNLEYAPKGSGLEFLNKTDDFAYIPEAGEKLNDLDMFL